MKRKHYMTMTRRQAAAAFEQHVAERPAALEHLRSELAADDHDPDALLDGTPESLTPLWRWVREHITATEYRARVEGEEPPAWWPGWFTYLGRGPEWPDRCVIILDGFVTYVEEVILRGAPSAYRAMCTDPIKRYWAQHHPSLTSPQRPGFLSVVGNVNAHAGGAWKRQSEPRDEQFTVYARAVIQELTHGREPADPPTPRPLVEVTLEAGEFDAMLRDDLAHDHSRKVDRMVRELRTEPGVRSAHREDREVLLVRAPDWSAADLERWLTGWITRHIADVC